ncbi:hypothetical protein PICSAR240_04476 [Mycobacterium avium subsp. paratuberculosis]|nr:hypothetical protein B0172_00594 [Mycobacterium avium subsp. paratuberculosis]OVF02006.1 hypothetical protein B0173_03828 [Mycobacterium avium subsp. paratuberculosis]QKU45144.1 hypothetical protein MAP44135_1734 [Mycobacterium avium subsp. paratuberculosis]CAG6935097.1 hypothetical protein PICSAR110_04455 [Mycobacterium avium subsp. paratuberculosis]CAG6935153.1 hypothetical protein PICSAR119_04423 [Mycobacterium avium subsp. paratuberculosis]
MPRCHHETLYPCPWRFIAGEGDKAIKLGITEYEDAAKMSAHCHPAISTAFGGNRNP